MRFLLMSSSRVDGTNYLEHAKSWIIHKSESTSGRALFIPYAGVSIGFEAYETMVQKAVNPWGIELVSIHRYSDPIEAVQAADLLMVGGGNTFCLLNSLYQNQLVEVIQNKVRQGMTYIGWSAGSNIASPTIRTTNDMPIIQPPSFDALGLVKAQINPHYIDGNPPGHQGETREQRITEFLKVSPETQVIGLPEGTALSCEDAHLKLIGSKPGFLFDNKSGKQSLAVNTDLSHIISI